MAILRRGQQHLRNPKKNRWYWSTFSSGPTEEISIISFSIVLLIAKLYIDQIQQEVKIKTTIVTQSKKVFFFFFHITLKRNCPRK